ncbi:MAG: hypothetical protein A3C85_01935 [Candidatus Doudnabacteria bacterium RIFCSPHIGHO2_02_FULL_48_21]|uniref:Rod shape-determining protein MreD n=1 Tax=Candidatus Doudnabacteria bacterium RIFCSPLOWO2_02_FULL_48_13 TaxID=1817845 RepID=A0A1F5Q8V6_9BACT|nr:MAG: hypothetical protein A3K05_02140 [Candidatus Doudnabacteria bacterium RIFCSPHIGHO2_01_48_18]OGE79834.1 MAG: hypothetical protein A2668_03700 [Candidatus Doudnabacteria bacterium RIFCSPHIGHO2_01_FULL_48_180]OGE91373.1 MAG: hypothetical protein A3F44_03690 [Candidatus Doudnabacteria bacterium RIFCSPHIGHO2_12_FULL_47_25]OGE93185.1 MAG: hypothetical protein A3C85_01935 [Candidatus Doudnabacteria bacterium RIFCSPHIGHO2_02_FULL_48_21]OGE96706.1 MAG: hypothetical protein A3A83_02810 [Candidatu
MFAYFLIFAATILRVLSHYDVLHVPPNVEPIAAMALFGGAYLNRRFALVVPILAMVVSDYFIGFDSLESRLAVYGSFSLSGLLGLWVRKNKSFERVVAGTLAGSLAFYLITNLVWLYTPAMYAHNWTGQAQSYLNALPFLRNTLVGDLFYVAVMFGSFELVRKYFAKAERLVKES